MASIFVNNLYRKKKSKNIKLLSLMKKLLANKIFEIDFNSLIFKLLNNVRFLKRKKFKIIKK